MAEYRRILLDGKPTHMQLIGGELVAADGRTADPDTATHLAPVTPSKIICVHLNYVSRVDEFMADRFTRTTSERVRGGYDSAGYASGRMAGDAAALASGDLTAE